MNLNKIIREEVRILNEVSLDVNKLGKALADVESYGGDYTATNPNSSAAGKYQFLWNTWGKEIERVTGVSTKQEFLDSPQDQEKFFKYYVNTELKPQVANLKQDSTKTDAALAALVHFQGAGGANRYLASGTETATDINMSVEKYLDKVEKSYYGSVQSDEPADSIEPEDSLESDIDDAKTDNSAEANEKLIDKIQFWMDWAGFLPFVGDAVDLINGLIYLIRGRYWDAILSGIAIIPGVGSAVAVPMRVATKAAKKTLGSGAIKILAAGGPRFQKWLVKLVKSGKVDANILEQVAKSGDDVAKMIQDASGKLSKVPGASKITKYTDEYIKLMKGRLDDIGKAAKASKKTATATKLDKSVDMIGKLAKRKVPLSGTLRRLTNFAVSKKLVRGVTSPTVLNGMRKGVQSKFITQISKNPRILNSIAGKLTKKQTDNLAKHLKVNPSEVQKLMKNTKTLNPKYTERLLKHMAENQKTFGNINKSLNKYKAAYVEQGISQIKNLSFKRGAGKFLFNTSDKVFSNINLPKFLSKSLYIAAALMDADDPELKSAGEDLQEAGIEQANLLATVSLSEPGDEQAQKEILNQQSAAAAAQEKADRALESIDSIDVEELSERDRELLNILIQQYIN